MLYEIKIVHFLSCQSFTGQQYFNIKHLVISAFAVATLIGCGDSKDEPTPPVVEPVDDVVFFDDFDSFNSAYWSKETHEAGWTNQELQSYSTSQVKVGKDDGKSVLILTAKRTGNKVVSGRVNTKNKKYFKLLLSGKKRQNHIFSTNITSYTCFTKKGLSFEAM